VVVAGLGTRAITLAKRRFSAVTFCAYDCEGSSAAPA
jgi:hypothetical protein